MRVLLVNPPFYRVWGSHYNGMMLGIASLVATLREAGHDAWQLNADFEPSDTYIPTSVIRHNATNGDGWKDHANELASQTAAAIRAFDADVVGYTCFSANYGMVLQIASLISAKQIIGGPHATVYDGAMRHCYRFDDCCIGEGERYLLSYLKGDCGNYEHPRIKDLDAIPLPDRDHWWSMAGTPMGQGELKYVNTSYIATARGCPYACSFCSAPKLWNRLVTYRSVQSVSNEFALLQNSRFDTHIVDDTFTFNKPRALAVMSGLCERHLTSHAWKCESRADAIDEDIADALVDSGCTRVKIGFESGDQSMLDRMGKRETLATMRNAVALLHDRRIAVTGYFCVGCPGETNDTLRTTIDFARSLEIDTYSLNVFAPYPGSKFYDEANGDWEQYIDTKPWQLFGQARIEDIAPHLSETLLEEYWSLSP